MSKVSKALKDYFILLAALRDERIIQMIRAFNIKTDRLPDGYAHIRRGMGGFTESPFTTPFYLTNIQSAPLRGPRPYKRHFLQALKSPRGNDQRAFRARNVPAGSARETRKSLFGLLARSQELHAPSAR
jgi:hypothetical protein